MSWILVKIGSCSIFSFFFVFAAKLTTTKSEAMVDIRKDLGCKIEAYSLPSNIEYRLLLLMKKLGLRYSTIDMRVNGKGEYYFFEVNPTGQYLYIETATNQPITASLAHLLSDPTPLYNGSL